MIDCWGTGFKGLPLVKFSKIEKNGQNNNFLVDKRFCRVFDVIWHNIYLSTCVEK